MRSISVWPVFTGALMLSAFGAAQAQDLTIGVSAEITSLDPQFQNVSSNSQFHASVFGTLTDRDHEAQLRPRLAESWENIDEVTWEFHLRPDVTFHNGSEFTAEDVVFSIERIATIENSPGPYTAYVSSVETVEAVDPLTVRVTTREPNPVLPLDLAAIFMLDEQTHQGATNEDFNSGEAAIGTGPYKVVSYRSRERVELERNDEYWGEAPDWETVRYRMIVDDAARTTALLSGDIDFMDQVPASTIERIESEDGLKVLRYDALRSVFFVVDQTGKGPFAFDNNGDPLPADVLQDLRVRRALSLAIDREAIVERIMEGAGVPTGQFMPQGALGHVDDIPVPEADPEEARRLLAEAGYPDGFRLTLHGPNGQYPNDAQIIQAVAQMWSRIGVETEVAVQPFAGFLGRAARQEFSAWLASWGSSTGEAGNTLRSIMRSYDEDLDTGVANRHRYSNPELDALIDKVSTTMDEGEREEYMNDAVRMAMEDLAIIPVLMLQNIAAMREDLEYVGRIDSHIRPHEIRMGER